jgi:hypothetical protein
MCFLKDDPPKSFRKEKQTCPQIYFIMDLAYRDINMFVPKFMVAPFISGCDRRFVISAARSVVLIKSSAEEQSCAGFVLCP